MSKLIIVESVKKAPLISSILDGYKVIASKGHVRKLPSKIGSVLPNEDFKMIWEVSHPGVVQDIIKHARNAELILLATDPDREGEAIGGHIAMILKEHKIDTPVLRIKFNSLEKSAVLDAVANPTQLDQNLINAYFARLSLDYLVGFELSPFLWRKIPGSRSAGRVQSVCLRIIVDREKEIAAFKSQDYWLVHSYADNVCFELKQWKNQPVNQFFCSSASDAQNIADEIFARKDWIVDSSNEKSKEIKPNPPFITATLQQDASSKLGFRPSKTMSLAQNLYEGVRINGELQGLITYMRTDSVHVHPDAINQCRDIIQADYGSNYIPSNPITYKGHNKAQNAHEAIRPTHYTIRPSQVLDQLPSDLGRLYKLIWDRAVASQMASAYLVTTTAQLKSKTDILETKASRYKFLGFKILYLSEDEDLKSYTIKFDLNQNIIITKTEVEANATKPPRRYSEAGIIRELEKEGIGRPSTYDKIVTVLQDRGYVRRVNKSLIPEDRGWLVSAALEEWFKKYVENKFTAEIEAQLDRIAEGTLQWKILLHEFWQDFHSTLMPKFELKPQEVQHAIHRSLQQYLIKEEKCQLCVNGTPTIKYSKNGGFVGCSNYPECKWIRPLTANHKVLYSDEDDNVVLKTGPYGLYALWEKSQKKVPIPANFKEDQVTWDKVKVWAQLPRKLGLDHEGNEISIGIGRFGTYVMKKNGTNKPEYRHLNLKVDSTTFELEDALKLLSQPKNIRARKVNQDVSESSDQSYIPAKTKSPTKPKSVQKTIKTRTRKVNQDVSEASDQSSVSTKSPTKPRRVQKTIKTRTRKVNQDVSEASDQSSVLTKSPTKPRRVQKTIKTNNLV